MTKAGRPVGFVMAAAALLTGTTLVNAAGAQQPQLSCGQVITRSTTLTTDVGPCPGDGLVIGADNITLNLNGHRIFGAEGTSSQGQAAGIRLPNRTNVRVVGGTVSDFEAGVVINRGSGNSVINMTVRDNVGLPSLDEIGMVSAPLGDGIAVFNSPNNRVLDNAVIGNGYYDGIGVWGLGSNSNIIEGNVVEGTLGVPHVRWVVAGGEGIILNSILGPDEIFEGRSLHNNRVARNIVRRNQSSGISTYSSADSALVANIAEGNGTAFPLGEFQNAVRPAGNGINVHFTFRAPRENTNVLVERNNVRGNTPFGLVVWTGGNRIIRNATGGNAIIDLFDRSETFMEWEKPCDNNVWFANTWGPPSSLAAEFGIPAYYPDCTSTGGSGPGDPGSRSEERPSSPPPFAPPDENAEQPARGNPTRPAT